jgi:outer membrane receptor for ferrienterochelin and colicins
MRLRLRHVNPPSCASVLLLLLLASVSGSSQEPRATVQVEVRTQSGPVEGAEVVLNGAASRTDENGIASGSAPFGEVKITVTKSGFLPANTTITVNEAREWAVTLELKPQETVEENITVYATRTDTRLQDSPVRVEVLSRDEIEEKMLMTPGDIVMMLNEMGGLRVQSTSPSLGAASVRIQGMRGRYTRFLSDGLPLFGQEGAGLGLLQIPPVDLGQVEVIKGTSSALYGAGAMAGVVNLISRRPASKPVHEFLLNRSTRGATDASFFLASRLSNQWNASLLGTGDWQEHNDIDHDGWADLAQYARGIVRPRFFWDGGEGKSALLTGGVTYEDRNGGTVPGAVLPATGAPYSEALNTLRYDFGGNAQFIIETKYVVTARLAASSLNHRHRFGEVLENDQHNLLFGEVAIRGTTHRNTWVAGFATERDTYNPRDVPRFAYQYIVPGVFIQDDIEIARWFSVSASARADFHNQFGTFLSPRVSALFHWDGWTSRLSAGQGFFAPTPLTEETEAAGLTRLQLPAPLLAERGRSASFDLTRRAGPASITATLFASTIRNPIFVDRSDQYEIVNLKEPTNNIGVELLGTWRKAPFSATASYTYVRSREEDTSGQRLDVPLTPRHSLGLVGMWEKEGVGRFGIECYYTGRQRLEFNPYRSASEPYVIVGAMGERKVAEHVRLFINLENLTDVRQTRWDPLLRPSRAVDGRWTIDAWSPLDGRNINGGVRFIF